MRESRKNIYSLRNLRHSYGKHPTLDIDALDIPEGGVIGLIGPNGSGKSTLLKTLAFLEPRDSGEIVFAGAPADGREQALRREVTLLLQEPYLLRRSVYENIAYGLRLRGYDRREIDAAAADALERVGMNPADFRDRPWFRLSGGEAQRVSLAVRLALRPRVLLLDEPTANVDEASAVRIKEAAWHAWHDWGTTIVVATHDLVWLYEVATAIVSLYRGRAIADGAANMIRGDWRREHSCATLSLRRGTIRACAPAAGTALECAVLNPSDISIAGEEGEQRDDENKLNYMHGSLTQLSFERASGQILGLVDCDGFFLRVRFPLETARLRNFYPGMPVTLTFPVASLRFV